MNFPGKIDIEILPTIYEGNWSNNVRDGFGACYYINGDFYLGYWSNNKRQG
jgi:hypothetical protein